MGAVQVHRPGDDSVRAMVWGADPDGSFGYAAAGLGDYDGDGYEDLGVGEPTYRVGENTVGAAYVFLGPFDGERGVDTAALTVRGEEAVDYVGVEVLGADLSGDGVPDFVVGGLATTLDTGPSAAGAVMAYTCAVTGLVGTADASLAWYGETVTGYFGWSAAPVPDVDGDGLVDLLVGAPTWRRGPRWWVRHT